MTIKNQNDINTENEESLEDILFDNNCFLYFVEE